MALRIKYQKSNPITSDSITLHFEFLNQWTSEHLAVLYAFEFKLFDVAEIVVSFSLILFYTQISDNLVKLYSEYIGIWVPYSIKH